MKGIGSYAEDWDSIARRVKDASDWLCIRCKHPHDPKTGYCLTVHHFDGNKSNNQWWNLMALCQRCHLKIQGKVNPDVPYIFEHSEWIKPYVAGFYAAKYMRKCMTEEEVLLNLETLLLLERMV